MMVDNHRPNQVVTPIEVAISNVALLLEQSNVPLVPGMQLLIWQITFPPSLPIKSIRINLYSAGKESNIPSLSYFKGISTLQPCHNLDLRDLGLPFLPQDIILAHYIDDVMLIGPSEREVATTLDLLVRYLLSRS